MEENPLSTQPVLDFFFPPIHWNLPVFTGVIMGYSVHAPEHAPEWSFLQGTSQVILQVSVHPSGHCSLSKGMDCSDCGSVGGVLFTWPYLQWMVLLGTHIIVPGKSDRGWVRLITLRLI